MRPTLGLYIHIPFCRAKCAYCDFYSLAPREGARDDYVRALAASLRGGADAAAGYAVDTVYFGGGTPSLLGAARLARLLDVVTAHYAVTPDAEITFEANPESARDADELRALRRAGFDRVSLGMQSAHDAELRAVGRVHAAADTSAAVVAARAAGFENLSLDLIYGLPEQTRKSWHKSLATAAALAPEHLSCYALKVEPDTPLAHAGIPLPDDDAQAELYLDAVDFCAAHGWDQYEISNFAKPGFASRHNLKYWTLGEYLGFGPGAHSDFQERRFAVARDLDAFLRGNIVYSEDAVISPQERAAERVMLGLRLTRGLPADELAGAENVLQACAAHALAVCDSGRWRLTPRGFLVSNEIILRVQAAQNTSQGEPL